MSELRPVEPGGSGDGIGSGDGSGSGDGIGSGGGIGSGSGSGSGRFRLACWPVAFSSTPQY